MASVPGVLNNVTVAFGPGINNDVNIALVNVLKALIRSDIVPGYVLNKIYISALHDHHTLPSQVNSRHNQGKGVDISRINDGLIAYGYPQNPAMKAFVEAIQSNFENITGHRENFGPFFCRKLGVPWPQVAAEHHNHIHLSVN